MDGTYKRDSAYSTYSGRLRICHELVGRKVLRKATVQSFKCSYIHTCDNVFDSHSITSNFTLHLQLFRVSSVFVYLTSPRKELTQRLAFLNERGKFKDEAFLAQAARSFEYSMSWFPVDVDHMYRAALVLPQPVGGSETSEQLTFATARTKALGLDFLHHWAYAMHSLIKGTMLLKP